MDSPLHTWADIIPCTNLPHTPCQPAAWCIRERPDSYPYTTLVAPLCFWQVTCAVGRAGWDCKAGPVAACRGNVVDTLCTQLPFLPCTMRGTKTQHEESQKEHLLGVLLELERFGCFTRLGFSVAVPSSSGKAAVWHFSPALMQVAARCGCC